MALCFLFGKDYIALVLLWNHLIRYDLWLLLFGTI
jgi:hypothetical protein